MMKLRTMMYVIRSRLLSISKILPRAFGVAALLVCSCVLLRVSCSKGGSQAPSTSAQLVENPFSMEDRVLMMTPCW